MARNGSGTFSNPYPNFVSGTVISSTQVDANNSDIATALTQSIAVDGQSTVTANLPMNAKKLTGLAVGAAATDSLNLGQAQAEAMVWCGTAGGSANAITLSPTPAITAYAAGQRFVWKASGSVNTGATTVAISGLGTIALQDSGAALVGGDHAAGKIYMGILDTTSTVQIINVQVSSINPLRVTSLVVSGTATVGGILSVDDTTTSTSGTTGSIHTDGGLGVAGTAFVAGAATVGGASQFNSTVTVGVNDTGYDVQFFGATSGAHMLWDESADDLKLVGAAGLTVAGNSVLASVDVTGLATAATFEPDGDTAAGDNAAIGYTAAEGLILTGQGSTSDITFKNDADATVMSIPTGTTNVGIGTISPSATLHVESANVVDGNNNGNVNILTSTAQAVNVGGKLDFGGFYDGSNKTSFAAVAGRKENSTSGNWSGYMQFSTRLYGAAFAERMRITSAGNVGIGTTAPVNKLEIAGGLYVSGNASYSASGYGLNLYNLNDTKTIGLAYNRTTSLFMDVLLAAKQFEFETNGTERMRIDSSGNVGIGTSPNTGGHTSWVNLSMGTKGSLISSTAAGGLYGMLVTDNLYIPAATGSLTYRTTNEASYYYQEAGIHRWLNAPSGTAGATATMTERMRIDASGNVMVGSTTTNPVAGRTNGAAILAGGSIVSRAISGGSYFGLSVTSGVNLYFYTDNGSAFVTGGNIATNGATTAYNATSDYRLKNNIQPLTDALSRVALLRPVKWTWKEELGGTDPNGEGFVAHELAEILPMAVTGEKDAVDAEGKPQYQGVDTSFLVATLTAAIQEQQVIIESFKTRITALEG